MSQEATLALSPKLRPESPSLGCKHCAEKGLGLREEAKSRRWRWPRPVEGVRQGMQTTGSP